VNIIDFNLTFPIPFFLVYFTVTGNTVGTATPPTIFTLISGACVPSVITFGTPWLASIT
jgi:hypothetical protein